MSKTQNVAKFPHVYISKNCPSLDITRHLNNPERQIVSKFDRYLQVRESKIKLESGSAQFLPIRWSILNYILLNEKIRPTPIGRVRDMNIFIDLTPPVSIKALKPTSFNSSPPVSIHAYQF